MKNLISLPHDGGLLLVNRSNLRATLLSIDADAVLQEAAAEETPYPPLGIQAAMEAVGAVIASDSKWNDDIVMRTRPEGEFGRVTWEITERCNFQCVHCYLGTRTRRGLPLEHRLLILDKLERAGCLWLQITGGEALADPLFEETYRAAWDRGMIISVLTNGAHLTRWINLFRQFPPRRVVVSLYGGSEGTYAEMTGAASTAYSTVMDALNNAQGAGLRLRVSIIGAKPNAHEIPRMEALLDELGIDYHVYTSLSPTVQGDAAPLGYEAKIPQKIAPESHQKQCAGGTTALHVHVSGRAGPCKLLPYVSVDLLSEDIAALKRLACHSGVRPTRPECTGCPSRKSCFTCAPVFALHKKAQGHTNRVCSYKVA